MYSETQLSQVTSQILPSSMNSSEILVLPTDEDQLHLVSLDASGNIADTKHVVSTSFPAIATVWGKTIYLVGESNKMFIFEECGPLGFAIQFCSAIKMFYDAVSYRPPHGAKKNTEKKKLSDSISEGEFAVKLLTDMHEDRKMKFPTRKSFKGPDGTVYSTTIDCFKDTMESWKALVKRLDFFDESLKDQVNPRTITNELLVEHSFGFTVKKGQYELQDMYQYIHNKIKHQMDFQMRCIDLPFNQYAKVKLRDKGYQQLDDDFKSKLDMDGFWDIYVKGKEKESVDSTVKPTDDQKRILRQAYLLTKSVPRQSTRSKWKEASGYEPNLLADKESSSKLLVGDLVFSMSFNIIRYLEA